ncbi:MAG: tetratricopeptide repeat protein [Acidobacteria bacterium]|nr:tetratricopeptide repeat protein [Acidobacteriota bacterium]
MFQAKSVTGVCLVVALCVAAASCSKSAKSYFESGNQYVAQKKLKEAAIEYKNAVQKDPNFGVARYKLAETLAELGDMPGAFREYVRASDLLPADKDAQLKAGTFLLLAGRFDDAKVRAQKVLAIDARNVQAQVLIANATAGLKNLDGAITEIRKAIEFDPKDARTYLNLGALQMASGMKAEAEATFKQAVEIDPKSVTARLALANFYGATGRAPEAEQSLTKASELDPKNVAANRALASFYLSTNRAPEAEAYLKAVADTTKDGGSQMALASYFVYMQRHADAIAILETLSKEKQTFATAKTRIASIQYMDRKPAEAHKTIDEVLAQEPANVNALLTKAQFLLAEKKTDDALGRVKAAVTADPRNPAAQYLLGTIYASRDEADEAIKAYSEVLKLNPRAVPAQLQLARLNLARGALGPAVQFAEQAVKGQPDNPAAHLILCRALIARGDVTRAETETKLLAEKFPNAAEVHALTGLLQGRKGDMAGARKSFERALQIDPASLDALGGLVALDFNAKKPADARARVDAALAKTPDNAPLLILAARTYGSAGDMTKAEQALVKIIEVDPSNLQAYGMLGQLYVSQNKLDQAKARFEDIVARQPKSVAAQTMIGMIYSTQGKNAEARKSYEKILDLDPRAPVAANNLAWMMADANENLDVALQLAKTAKSVIPNSPDVDDTLGWIYYKKGLNTLAITSFRDALAKAPTNAAYHYRLGLAYLKNNDPVRAKESLTQALKLDPKLPQAADARRALDSLPK